MKIFKIIYEVSKEYEAENFEEAMKKHEDDDKIVALQDENTEYIDVTRGYEIDKNGIKLEDHI